MRILGIEEPLGVEVVERIRTGDLATLRRLLVRHRWLSTCRIRGTPESPDQNLRSLLHVVADWPGHYPNGAATVALLVEAGADVGARFAGPHEETPLHWAASCDDVEVLDALLDAGADIEADGAVIGGGTALADATAFGQWRAARRLLERGARTTFWEAAALGLVERVRENLRASPPPSRDAVTRAFWGACHGGQLAAAKLLCEHGADSSWLGWDGLTPLDAALRSDADDVVEWLRGVGARSASELA
ncbi:MAG TPA: ankyrin repeat domain-containing protein [Thermoanaerobaculia bacterium]|nr:ankyrin repeat domain-containing protein [Thermoanaerobaculia bacterium]